MLIHTLNDSLSLHFLKQEDAGALLTLCQAEGSSLSAWLPWVAELNSLEACERYIQEAQLQFAQQRALLLGVCWQGQLVGLAGFNGLVRSLGRGRIGYWLATPYRGRGIMTMVVTYLIRQGLEEMGLQRLEVHTHCDNEPSRALCERLGLVLHSSREPGLVCYRAEAGRWRAPDLPPAR
ncbi:GNAT family N-acetyltransferase [Pseudaeromonas paramecii]|uniref:GNAT family protein n=1 Tax=Pseudaeromonas paramecii TaxID=2138166 RepID=A0ABP8PW49_9GAMM